MTPDLLTLFLQAVRVDAPSHRERPMADFIRRVLEDLPVEVREDDTARFFGGECGNILCVPRGFDPDRPAIALSAHMDTPRPTASVRPLVTADRVVSDGTGALGADDRAGVAVLLHALRAQLILPCARLNNDRRLDHHANQQTQHEPQSQQQVRNAKPKPLHQIQHKQKPLQQVTCGP